MLRLFSCLIAGLVSACAFAPLDLWPLGLAGMAFLLWQVSTAPTLRAALARGWWFGLGQFALSLNWIATAFTYQANMPAWLGWIAVVVLSLYLAVYPAVAAGLGWKWSDGGKDRLRLVLVFAAAWIVCEYLRGSLFTGFPWNPLGIMLLLTPAADFAALAGTYALGGLAILAAGALFLLAMRDWRRGAGLAVAVIALSGTAWLAAPRAPDSADGPAIRVVQPGVSQAEKHGEGYEPLIRERLSSLTEQGRENRTAPPRLVLWPEDAMPYFLDEDRLGAMEIGSWLGARDLLLTGAAKIERERDGWAIGARNSVYVVNGAGRLLARYDKAHLVPYGEYLPMRPLLSAIGLSRIVPGDLDFWEGPGPHTINVPGFARVGVQICYEIVFSGHVVDEADRPDFIFNPSNDAWFGWWGPPQHFAQARLRAIEEGLPVVRSTPTGVSGVIDAHGRIVALVGMGEAGIVDANLPPAAGRTAFSHIGNWGAFLFAALILLVAFAPGAIRHRLRKGAKGATEHHT